MATIIDLGSGRYIAGDPESQLPLGHHWCDSCGGDGLEYSWYDDDELQICGGGCNGSGVLPCEDTACDTHSSLHPRGVDA